VVLVAEWCEMNDLDKLTHINLKVLKAYNKATPEQRERMRKTLDFQMGNLAILRTLMEMNK
jgi:hypothetical protein